MVVPDKVRIDKWLWAVRVFKTRSQASEACKKGRILIDGFEVKPSRNIRRGETVFIRKLPVVYQIRVTDLVENRLPAQRVPEFAEDLTSAEELEKLKLKDTVFFKRDKGTGRPTKKDRRLINEILKK